MRNLVAVFSLVVSLNLLSYSQTNSDSTSFQFETRNSTLHVDSLVDLCRFFNTISVDSSLYYGHLALEIAENSAYKEGIRAALFQLGRTNIQALNFDAALKCLQESMENTDTLIQTEEAANTVNNIGIVYYLTGDYNKALNLYIRALHLHKEKSEVGVKLNYNIGIIKAEQKEYDSAIYCFNKAYQLVYNVDINDKTIMPYIQANLAEVYSVIGNETMARVAAQQSITDFNSIENLSDPGLFISLGSTYRSINEFDKAEKAILKAIQMAQNAKALRRERNAYQFLIEIYRDRGNYKQALVAHEKFTQLNDSTLNLEKNKQILELEAKYENEKKEQAIELLQKEAALSDVQLKRSKLRNYFFILLTLMLVSIFILLYREYKIKVSTNTKLNEVNSSLIASKNEFRDLNTMKDNLIRIIGHDLKGPIGSIVGFSELLKGIDFKEKPEKAIQYSEIIYNTTTGVSQLLDNILYWASIQQGSYEIKAIEFSVSKAISHAVDPLHGMAENKQILIHTEVDENMKAFGDSFSCSIVIGNLISNAIKFSPKGKSIYVSATENSKFLIFSVKDEGIGMNQKQVDNIFVSDSFTSTQGTNDEKGTGLGLKICKHFVELNGGVIKVESASGAGTLFTFSFPKA